MSTATSGSKGSFDSFLSASASSQKRVPRSSSYQTPETAPSTIIAEKKFYRTRSHQSYEPEDATAKPVNTAFNKVALSPQTSTSTRERWQPESERFQGLLKDQKYDTLDEEIEDQLFLLSNSGEKVSTHKGPELPGLFKAHEEPDFIDTDLTDLFKEHLEVPLKPKAQSSAAPSASPKEQIGHLEPTIIVGRAGGLPEQIIAMYQQHNQEEQ